MSYYIEPGEPFARGLTRIRAEQSQKAIDALTDPSLIREGTHKARKHFKKLRAIYRLTRDATGRRYYKNGNVFYRNRGRELEPLRDITSLIEALDTLSSHFAGQVKPEAFHAFGELLKTERRSIRQDYVGEEADLKAVRIQLEEQHQHLEPMPVADDDLEATVKSLHRVYKRGHRGFCRAQRKTTPERMHEWRKRVKYLWYHHRLLKKTWPRVYKAYAKSCKALSDWLGDHHDLALLEQKANQCAGALETEQVKVIRALCREQQRQLESAAFELGARVYAEAPKAWARRQRALLAQQPF